MRVSPVAYAFDSLEEVVAEAAVSAQVRPVRSGVARAGLAGLSGRARLLLNAPYSTLSAASTSLSNAASPHFPGPTHTHSLRTGTPRA